MALRRTLARLVPLLCATLLAACGDDGPDCVPDSRLVDQVAFETVTPGPLPVPFADAVLEQYEIIFLDSRCPANRLETYLYFDPLSRWFVDFDYDLDVRFTPTSGWFYRGSARFSGSLAPTNSILVSDDGRFISDAAIDLVFTSFEPF
ncbi:MAG: hypothetical protein MUC69_05130 [Gemmatimonadales bacterium]|jgi:hypothetical protein|nr:hypothetical protein [Gemmatimonadales bacterium]